MAKKRSRVDSDDNGPEFLFPDPEVLDPKRVSKNACLATSPLQASLCCVRSNEEESVGVCLEEQGAVTSATLLYPEAIGWGPEVVHSADGTGLASKEEFNDHAVLGTVGWHDDSLTAEHSQQQLLRRTLSRGAESCCGDDAQVDINCFLETGDESLYDLAYNPAQGCQGNLHLKLAESLDAVSTACTDDCGVGVIPDADWFLSDLERDGQFLSNEELDEEWMTAAVANLDRINDTFDADASMLELLEAGPLV